MIQYIYFVKCPGCEDEHFDFFDDAKEFALSCLSQKPVITQTEVCRNDFGECTDHCDLGTVWSWEDMMKDTAVDPDSEPAKCIFTRDDLKQHIDDNDPEFDTIDNSVDFEPEISEVSAIDKVPDNFRKPIPEGMTLESLVETLEESEDEVECKNCFDLFPKVDCTKHDHGYVCPVCGNVTEQPADEIDKTLSDLVLDEFEAIDGYEVADEIVQHADIPEEEKVEILDTLDHIKKEEEEHIDELKELFGESESEVASNAQVTLDEDLKPITWICDFDGKEIGTVEATTEEEAYLEMERRYPDLPYGLYDGVAIVYPENEDELAEALLENAAPEELHDLGNEYDGGYPKEKPELPEIDEVSDSHLKLCPECGKETFDLETGICIECGFN